MDELVEQAQAILGSLTPDDIPPLIWLSEKNPLLRYPELKTAIEEGRLRVHSWGNHSLWRIPGYCCQVR